MKILIYTGLSIPFDEARQILDSSDDVEVIYKRPIKRGDLGHDIKENPDIIGIIDGVFHQNWTASECRASGTATTSMQAESLIRMMTLL